MNNDINIFFNFIDKQTVPILKLIRSWNKRSIKIWYCKDCIEDNIEIKKIISQRRDFKCIEDNISIDHSISYYEWQLSEAKVLSCTNALAALIHRNKTNSTNYIVIDSNLTLNSKRQIVAFTDAQQKPDLPDKFYKFPCFSNSDAIFDYCKCKGIFQFDKDDTSKYQPTGKQYNGANIYKVIKDNNTLKNGYYFYLDTLHKNHYEVFDPTGKIHLGEMNLDGVLDKSKADRKKRI